MKSLLIATLMSFIATLSMAQTTVNNKIGTVEELNIYGKSNVIIGKVIVNQTLHTKILFAGQSVVKDSLGFYITTYKFIPIDNPGIYKVNVSIEFDKPFIAYENQTMPFKCEVTNNISCAVDGRWANNLTAINVKATISGDDFMILVKSRNPLFAKIQGVDGKKN